MTERDYVVIQEGVENRDVTADGWQMYTLGELTENFDAIRCPVKEADRRPGSYPYYGASGVVDYVDGYLFDGEYLLIAEDGENLRTRITPIAFLANGKFWVNNHAHIVRGNSGADTRFLKYALSLLDISGYLTGSTMPKLTQGNLNRITFLTPPIPEQRAIAHVLGTLDDKIELNRRMNETLEAMARALFKSWFVDFDPVRAKMEGRWRRGQSLPGLPADLYDLFPDRLVDSELGEIPEGWGVGIVSQLAERIQNGGTPKRSEPTYWETRDIPWLTSGEVRQSFVLDTQNYISRQGLEHSSAKMIPARSILVALYGATAGQVSMNIRPLTTNQAISAIIPGDGNRYFCLVSLKLQVGELGNRAVGSAQQNLSKQAVESTNVVLPPIELRLTFDLMVERLFERIFRNLDESRTLTAQRDALLPGLVSGGVGVGTLSDCWRPRTNATRSQVVAQQSP